MIIRIAVASAIILFGVFASQEQSKYVELKETYYFSRECPNGGDWVRVDQDKHSVTFECDYQEEQ